MIFFGSSVSSSFEIEERIRIETNVSEKGLPTFEIYGMVAKSIEESKKRIVNSFESNGITFPLKNISINLSPAEYLKHGTHFDLGIAATILKYTNCFSYNESNTIFLGELSFDGSVKGLNNILYLVLIAKNLGYQNIYIPYENLKDITYIKDLNLFGINNLKDLLDIDSIKKISSSSFQFDTENLPENFSKILGNSDNKKVIAYSLAGKHHLLISGFPGSGKSLLAKASQDLIPDLSFEHAYDVAKIFSYLRLERPIKSFLRPPFRSPHSTSSYSSIFGGVGKEIFPGEITISNNGILFLDELPEFNRTILEGLRSPMEDKFVSISRSKFKKILPADFILIATMNPCKCGYFNHHKLVCKCTPIEIKRYQTRISGPILDRIDMHLGYKININVNLSYEQSNYSFEEFSSLKNRIIEVRSSLKDLFTDNMQKNEYRKENTNFIHKLLNTNSINLINLLQERYSISNRKLFKILNLANTISFFNYQSVIKEENILEAVTLSGVNQIP